MSIRTPAKKKRKPKKQVQKTGVPKRVPRLLVTFQKNVIGSFRDTLTEISKLMDESRNARIHFTEGDLRNFAERGRGSLIKGVKIKKTESARIARDVGNLVNNLENGKAKWMV